jgi:hypothetical protein
MNFRTADNRHIPGVIRMVLAAVPVLVIAILLGVGWRKWPDILVDFGREVYIPWQISTGKVLYRDIEYFFGPLSVSVNSLLFRLFGPSLAVLFSANILFYCAFMAFLYRFLARITSTCAASIACSVLAVFTMSQFTLAGNYNFIAPYSHESIHGVMLFLVALDQLRRFAGTGRTVHLLAGGVLSGCVLLTRLEIAVVSCIVVGCFFMLTRFSQEGRFRIGTRALVFLGGMVLPLLLFFIYFSAKGADGLLFLTEPWRFMVNSSITGGSFYRSGLGADDLPGNLLRMVCGGAFFVLPPLLLLHVRFLGEKTAVAAWSCLAIYFSVMGWYWSNLLFFPALPLFVFGLTVYLYLDYRRSADGGQRQSVLALLLLSLFVFGLLCKMLFNCRISQYGFYITAPALAVGVAFLVGYLPPVLDARGMAGVFFRRAMVVFVTVLAVRHGVVSGDYYARKTYPVALSSADRILTMEPSTDPRGVLVDKALQWIEANMHRDETLLVVPEGVMINFLSRRRNPTRYVNFMMPELVHFGERTILQDFRAHSPDVVMLVLAKDTSEYGVGPFGLDPANGELIVNWIEAEYRPVMLFGGDPLEGKYIGVKIYRKAVKARETRVRATVQGVT